MTRMRERIRRLFQTEEQQAAIEKQRRETAARAREVETQRQIELCRVFFHNSGAEDALDEVNSSFLNNRGSIERWSGIRTYTRHWGDSGDYYNYQVPQASATLRWNVMEHTARIFARASCRQDPENRRNRPEDELQIDVRTNLIANSDRWTRMRVSALDPRTGRRKRKSVLQEETREAIVNAVMDHIDGGNIRRP